MLSQERLTADGGEPDAYAAGFRVESPVPGVAPLVPRRVSAGALIETKLHAPAVRKEWVEREELIGYLAACATSRLVLVDARAGFGKTTLVAQWRSSPGGDQQFTWISLDRGDNDPAVVVCRQRADPGLP